MQNLENLDVFEILITQKLLICPKDPFVRSALKYLYFFAVQLSQIPTPNNVSSGQWRIQWCGGGVKGLALTPSPPRDLNAL